MKGNQLTFAREYRGYTQKALAASVPGLSQSNLSKYEHGMGILSDDVLSRIMRFLNFPMAFLDLNINNNIENKHYRSKASISATKKRTIDREIALVAYCFDWFSDFVELPEYTFGCYDLEEGFSPEDVARQTRRKLRLGADPIKDICTLCEANGVFVYQIDTDCVEFDGVSLITDKGNHLIIINGNRSNDRTRLTIAHELGHIMMHENINVFINPARNKEKEATAFAAEFLMPESLIKNSLYSLKMSQLPSLKTYWLTSMSSIVERARLLGTIDKDRYTGLRCEFSRNHWNKKEPMDVPLDSPSVVKQILELVTGELGYTNKEVVEGMKIAEDAYLSLFGERKPKVIAMKSIF